MDLETSRHRDQVDWLSPAVDPLEFPVPTIYACHRQKILARDHRTGDKHLVKALLKRRQGSNSAQCDIAYLLKKIMSRSEHGQEKTWAAVVLAPVSGRPHLSCTGQESPFGVVHWESTNKIVAIRVSSWTNLSHFRKQTLIQEVSALQYVGSCNTHVQGCLEVLKDDQRMYTILPYCLEESLTRFIEPADKATVERSIDGTFQPNEDRARTWFKQLCRGLLHLQQKGVYHGNICPRSIFVVENQTLVIGDLGVSLRVPFSDPFNDGYIIPQGTSRRLLRNRGSRSEAKYQAPEVTASGFDTFASDVWSAGIVLFELLTGITPFKRAKTSDVVFKVVSSGHLQELMESWDITLCPEACDLLQSILRRKPTDRITLPEIMEHPWVLGKTLPPSQEEPRSNDKNCDLPAYYNEQKMELLRKDIVQRQRKEKPTLDRKMRLSLRRELILRTSGNAKRVSFGIVEVFSPYSVSDPSCRIVQVDQYEQERTLARQSQTRQTLIVCRKSTAKVTKKPAHAESEKKVTGRRHVGALTKLVRSAKKKLKNAVAKKVRIDIDGPVLFTARSA